MRVILILKQVVLYQPKTYYLVIQKKEFKLTFMFPSSVTPKP